MTYQIKPQWNEFPAAVEKAYFSAYGSRRCCTLYATPPSTNACDDYLLITRQMHLPFMVEDNFPSRLVKALKNLSDLSPGKLLPVSLGPNRTVGSVGACIVLIESLLKYSSMSLSQAD